MNNDICDGNQSKLNFNLNYIFESLGFEQLHKKTFRRDRLSLKVYTFGLGDIDALLAMFGKVIRSVSWKPVQLPVRTLFIELPGEGRQGWDEI